VAKIAARQLAKTEARAAADGRHAQRHKFVHFLWFQRLDGANGALGRSVDVSENGIGFIANHEIAVTERVFLVLLTPFGRISSIARVMHCSAAEKGAFRIGVRLEIVPPTDKAVWTTLVDKEAR
jgi:hypothetical protein